MQVECKGMAWEHRKPLPSSDSTLPSSPRTGSIGSFSFDISHHAGRLTVKPPCRFCCGSADMDGQISSSVSTLTSSPSGNAIKEQTYRIAGGLLRHQTCTDDNTMHQPFGTRCRSACCSRTLNTQCGKSDDRKKRNFLFGIQQQLSRGLVIDSEAYYITP